MPWVEDAMAGDGVKQDSMDNDVNELREENLNNPSSLLLEANAP